MHASQRSISREFLAEPADHQDLAKANQVLGLCVPPLRMCTPHNPITSPTLPVHQGRSWSTEPTHTFGLVSVRLGGALVRGWRAEGCVQQPAAAVVSGRALGVPFCFGFARVRKSSWGLPKMRHCLVQLSLSPDTNRFIPRFLHQTPHFGFS